MEMDKFIELLGAVVKDGTDMGQIKEAAMKLNPMASITDKESAWKLAMTNDYMSAAFNTKLGERVNTAEKTLMEGKVANLLSEKEAQIRAELNPQEDERDKKIRELMEKDKARDAKEQLRALQDTLSNKAKDLNFDPMKARDFAAFGDQAEAKLSEYAEFFNSSIEEKVNSQVKDRFSSNAPKVKVPSSGLITMSDTELNQLVRDRPEMKSAVIGEITRRTTPQT